MESESFKTIKSEPNVSLKTWTWQHPNIQPTFFENLVVPIDVEDAHLLMCCHQHTEKDFDLQLKAIESELEEYLNQPELPIVVAGDLITENRAAQVKFLRSKRYHHNAWCCYWYWMQKESNQNQKKAKRKNKTQK